MPTTIRASAGNSRVPSCGSSTTTTVSASANAPVVWPLGNSNALTCCSRCTAGFSTYSVTKPAAGAATIANTAAFGRRATRHSRASTTAPPTTTVGEPSRAAIDSRCGWAASLACRREPTAASGRFVAEPCAKCHDSADSTAAAPSHDSNASGRHGRGMRGDAVTASSSTGDDERVLRTWLTERFDLQVPVVSAPMAGVSGGALAGAVSAAGGLGLVGWVGPDVDKLKLELVTAAQPGRAFGIGFLAWTMRPGDEQLVDAALEAGASLVCISYGDYEPYVERITSAGAVAATQVGTLEDVRRATEAGVNLLVVRGGEGGGHGRDAVATLPLLQAVLDETDLPVLAAGGIATARGLAAVLAAGAAGGGVGTAFLATHESAYKDGHKDAVVAAGLDASLHSTVFDIGRGSPWPPEFGGRALRNAYSDTWHGREAELRAAPVPTDEPIVWAGQVAGLVKEKRPAAEVVAELADAERLLAEVCTRTTGG